VYPRFHGVAAGLASKCDRDELLLW
jgi:hypothetical protein